MKVKNKTRAPYVILLKYRFIAQDKRLVRTDALRLYEALRSTARVPKENDDFDGSRESKKLRKSTKTIIEPHKLSYGPRESVAYAAGVLPSTFAAARNVMTEISNRIIDFKPQSMLDFGTGPGTAIWYVHSCDSTSIRMLIFFYFCIKGLLEKCLT